VNKHVTFRIAAKCCGEDLCYEAPTNLGYCDTHYRSNMDRMHSRLQRAGVTTAAPPCFESQQEWQDYEVLADQARWVSHKPPKPKPANPCRDCTPKYQADMAEQGRCTHPETVFVIRHRGGLEGVNKAHISNWLSACNGEMGKVVSAPSTRMRIQTLGEGDEASGS